MTTGFRGRGTGKALTLAYTVAKRSGNAHLKQRRAGFRAVENQAGICMKISVLMKERLVDRLLGLSYVRDTVRQVHNAGLKRKMPCSILSIRP